MSQLDLQYSSSSSTTTRSMASQGIMGGQTTPLRIAKTRRDTVQTQLARRQSSSYNHVRNNNLVTNSPFKRLTRIPTPRKASVEKPIVVANVENNENEDPVAKEFGVKRKQSRSFREVEKGHMVTKSPFLNKQLPAMPSRLVSTPPRPPVAASNTSPSPRSSLVSKRLRGPRSTGSSPTSTPGRRNRRKTVTFDERCDVVEFEAESEQSQESEDRIAATFQDSFELEDPNELIDSILQDTLMNVNPDDSLVSLNSSVPSLSTSPISPQQYMSPDYEDGIPYGRSHYAERQHNAYEGSLLHTSESFEAEAEGPLDDDDCGLDSARAYHMIHKHSIRHQDFSVEADAERLPGSPSPARQLQKSLYTDEPIPRLELPDTGDHSGSFFDMEDDPFFLKPASKALESSPRPSPTEEKEFENHEEMNCSPLLHHAQELVHATTIPTGVHSDGSSNGNETSFVSAHSGPLEGPMSPPQNSIPAKSSTPLTRQSPELSSVLPPSQQSLQPPMAPQLERPSSICSLDFQFGQPGVEIGDMKSALDRLVIDARELTKESIQPVDLPNNSMNSEGREVERRLSQGVFDESIVTETEGDEEEDTRELIFPTPPPIISASYRLSRSIDMEISERGLQQEVHGDPVEARYTGLVEGYEEHEAGEDEEEERALTPVPSIKRDLVSPQLPEIRRFSFDSDLGFGSTTVADFVTPPPVSSEIPQAFVPAVSPPSTPKSPRSAIAERQAAIAQRRKEIREADAEIARKIRLENEVRERERQAKWQQQQDMVKKGEGRKSARRSLSTGDVHEAAQQQSHPASLDLLNVSISEADEEGLNLDFGDGAVGSHRERPKDRKYHLKEKSGMIYASSDDKVSHLGSVGDVDLGRAWKAVRRPSDMNEYSRQIKEIRAQEKPGRAYAKVFVKVLAVRLNNIPLPSSETVITCTLNNGIHFVTTPECKLDKETRIEQEFELIEHTKLEFTMTLKARRDPHIMAMMKNSATLVSQARPRDPSPPPRRRLGFFGSPKKSKAVPPPPRPATPPVQVQPLPETFGRYLQNDGTFGRVFISFKEIASRCDTRLLETSFPVLSRKSEVLGETSVTIGEMILHIFRLPPLPGIPLDQLPQSLDESIRGLRHINWHKVTYHEGTLTQLGGDCSTWRRRRLRVIGAKLVAFNDVTKKPIAAIDLRKAIGVEDDQNNEHQKSRQQYSDEFDALYGVERSFKLLFPKEESISFFADNDAEKAKWLEVLRALVGRIPPNPLWAELLWQKQEGEASCAPPPPVSK